MPIYLYKCPECGTEIEQLQDYDARAPVCQGDGEDHDPTPMERKIGKPNAHFSGEGFHTTDYDDAENPASKD
jgi:putative FmdB family regulatory protein